MPNYQSIATLNIRSGPGTSYDVVATLDPGDVVAEVAVPQDWCPIELEDGTIGFVSRKYLTTPTEKPEAPVTPVTPGAEPIWIQWARKQLGQREVPGPGDNPTIAAWYHLTTLDQSYWHDETAWCAVFVNAGLMLNNIKTIRSAAAVDWLKFGTPVTTPQKGDVVVFLWDSGSHHVAYYLADAGGGRIQVIGGNQSDAVTITTYPKANVMGYRRPPTA
jgi:uncharacterized protein (TIGR02594 family)